MTKKSKEEEKTTKKEPTTGEKRIGFLLGRGETTQGKFQTPFCKRVREWGINNPELIQKMVQWLETSGEEGVDGRGGKKKKGYWLRIGARGKK